MGNVSTHCVVHADRYAQYDLFETKYDFSVFGCDVANDFVEELFFCKKQLKIVQKFYQLLLYENISVSLAMATVFDRN